MNHTYFTKCFAIICTSFFLLLQTANSQTDPNQPNILLIIADDMGVDITNGFQQNQRMPVTPVIDSLRAHGVSFMNTWAAPACTPTRASIMSGHYGVKTNVSSAPGNLHTAYNSIFKALAQETGNAYADAVIGKWHISNPHDYNHPAQHDIDHYEGVFSSSVDDYYDWEKVNTNGTTSMEMEYTTTNLTNDAIDWVNNQNQAWFLWLAHVAPHTPFHVPPATLYTSGQTNSNIQKYVVMIEAMDAEIGRLLDNISPAVLANTVVIFVGDNGTPTGVIQNFPSDHAKNTLYQGGIHVPMIVSGAGVTRQNEQENALTHVTDIYATVLDIAGANLPGGIYNSMSFAHKLSNTGGVSRPFNYTDLVSSSVTGWTIRDDQYKLIEFADGTQEFYDLITDPLESNNLINSLTPAQQTVLDAFEAEAEDIRHGWSCQDLIQNGVESGIDTDCELLSCPNNNTTSITNIGCCDSPIVDNYYTETVCDGTRSIHTNNFPNHDYCYKNQASMPEPKDYQFQITSNPVIAPTTTSILNNTNRPNIYFGVALNGVLIAPAPATPFIFENTLTGEFNWNWVFEPTNNQGSGQSKVALDCASAHTGPQGYHYHGNMFEYAENIQAGLSTTTTPPTAPIQIGWAADGFPILYRFAPDVNGNLSLLQPSYQLKAGDRPGDGIGAPCGPYNGKYTNDYEYVAGTGDLDECNGIAQNITLQTANGSETFDYFYVVTDAFPQVPRRFRGYPEMSFDSANKGDDPIINNTAVAFKVFLEGAYLNGTGTMRTDLVDNNLIPATQTYNQAPFNYSGTETISTFSPQMVDWVLVEQRTGINADKKVATKAGILMADGSIKDVDGTTDLTFDFYDATGYYFVIRHRNHLDIMTRKAEGCSGIFTYDFTNDVNQAFGNIQLKTMTDGTTTMFAGDITEDHAIQTTDFDVWKNNPALLYVYNNADLNLDGVVQVTDYDVWYHNKAKLAPSETDY